MGAFSVQSIVGASKLYIHVGMNLCLLLHVAGFLSVCNGRRLHTHSGRLHGEETQRSQSVIQHVHSWSESESLQSEEQAPMFHLFRDFTMRLLASKNPVGWRAFGLHQRFAVNSPCAHRARLRQIPQMQYASRPITKDDVSMKFVRSSGAGGQNVNKVSTKVDMKFDILNADWIPDEVREHMMDAEKNRINSNGELMIQSEATRSQQNNIQDALRRIQRMIDFSTKAVTPKEPNKAKQKRVKDLKKKNNEKRLKNKKRQSDKKKSRGKVNLGDW